jgi:hypothetical protein
MTILAVHRVIRVTSHLADSMLAGIFSDASFFVCLPSVKNEFCVKW